MIDEIFQMARLSGAKIATAESCTGGLVAATLTQEPGSSAIFLGGVVTYSNASKEKLLGVPASTLNAHGAVSEQVAARMARGVLGLVPEATLAVSITGIAGPGGSEHKPEGRVCFGLAQLGHSVEAETIELGAIGRTEVRNLATYHALSLLLKALRR